MRPNVIPELSARQEGTLGGSVSVWVSDQLQVRKPCPGSDINLRRNLRDIFVAGE